MNKFNYERLTAITKDTKPYRKNIKAKYDKDRYPLEWRGHGNKCFFVEQDENGDIEYHVNYGYRYVEHPITKEKYDEIIAKNGWGARDRGNGIYTEWASEWNTIGIVRKDNTLELTANNLHQGTRWYMSHMMGKYHSEVVSSVKHGGTVYREYQQGEDDKWEYTVVIPLFNGQRINLETNRSVLNYEVHLPYVNRERGKAVMARFKDSFNFAETMFKTMTSEVFASEMQEVYQEAFINTDYKPDWINTEAKIKMSTYANSQINTDLYKAMYAVMMATGTLNSWSIGTNSQYYRGNTHYPHTYFGLAKQKFVRKLKLENNALDIKVHKANEPYPSNSWEIKILLDGKQVQAY